MKMVKLGACQRRVVRRHRRGARIIVRRELAWPLVVMMPFLQILYMWNYLSSGRATALLYVAVGACWLVTLIRRKRTS